MLYNQFRVGRGVHLENTISWTLTRTTQHICRLLCTLSLLCTEVLLTICEGVEGLAGDVQRSKSWALGLGGPPAGEGSL